MGMVSRPEPTSSEFIHTSQRPRYLEIRAVMEQIPEIQKDSLDQFDCKLLNPSLQKVADKRRKDQFKRLIAGCIGVGATLDRPLAPPAARGCPRLCGKWKPAVITTEVSEPLPRPTTDAYFSFYRNPWENSSEKKYILRISPHFSKKQSQ